jgi:Cu2+-exporting ATPase
MASRISPDGEVVAVPTTALSRGDVILVRPGERVPTDGIVLSGRSELDESLVSGETTRRNVAEGAEIHAGTLNFSGALRVEVRAEAGNTLLDEIERLIEGAIAGKSRYRRLADRAARIYAPVVHLTALSTAIGWLVMGASAHDAVITAIAVLIITCPCALALAVPAVQVVASGSLFDAGVLLSASDAIERLAQVDTIIFDKTGTLTLAEHSLVNAAAVEPAVLRLAARLAVTSHHPLASAVAAQARAGQAIEGAAEIPGEGVRAIVDGVEARLGSPTFCAVEQAAEAAHAADPEASLIAFRHGDRAAVFLVRQVLRTDAAATIAELRRKGLAVMIMSGDRIRAVEGAAQAVGVGDWRAQMKPADKVALLEDMRRRGREVLMVGDGMNDAPALAAAYVSLSPITGSDLAQASADAIFLGDKLSPVLRAVEISRSARNIMGQNLALAVVYNLLAVPLAIAGLVTPLIAAAAMSGSSILVTLNALRTRARRSGETAAATPRSLLAARS